MPERSFDLAEFVAASCEAQGVAVFVTDAAVVARVAALLGGGVPGGGRQPAPDTPPVSELPHDRHAVGVEAGASSAGSDDSVIDQGTNDGGLAGEAQVGPPVA